MVPLIILNPKEESAVHTASEELDFFSRTSVTLNKAPAQLFYRLF